MPTATFEHLPEEKRAKLTRAIYEEMARVPFEEVSINRIIQEAGIPRGSYYQYFVDRDDLFDYAMRDFQAENLRRAQACLLECGGELFTAAQELLERLMAYGLSEERISFCRNVFTHLKFRQTPLSQLAQVHASAGSDWLSAVDRSGLKLESEEEFVDLAELLTTELCWAMVSMFCAPERRNEIQASFRRKLGFIRRGVQK